MSRTFHEDATCGCCGGPLDACRDAICFDCCSEEEEHALFVAAEEIQEALSDIAKEDKK